MRALPACTARCTIAEVRRTERDRGRPAARTAAREGGDPRLDPGSISDELELDAFVYMLLGPGAPPFPPHRGGGNRDNRSLGAGSRLWVPVWCETVATGPARSEN